MEDTKSMRRVTPLRSSLYLCLQRRGVSNIGSTFLSVYSKLIELRNMLFLLMIHVSRKFPGPFINSVDVV